MTAAPSHTSSETARDAGGPSDRPELDLVRDLFAAFTYDRSGWFQFVDRQGWSLAESGERPGDGSASSSAEVRVGGRHVGTVFGVPSAGGGDVSDGLWFTRLVASILSRILYQEVELDSLTAELLVKYEEMNLLLALSRAFTAELDVPGLCTAAVDMAVEAFEPDAAWVAVASDEAAPLCVLAVAGLGPVLGHQVARGEGCADR